MGDDTSSAFADPTAAASPHARTVGEPEDEEDMAIDGSNFW